MWKLVAWFIWLTSNSYTNEGICFQIYSFLILSTLCFIQHQPFLIILKIHDAFSWFVEVGTSIWALLAALEDLLPLGSASTLKAPLLQVLILSHGWEITVQNFWVLRVMLLTVGLLQRCSFMENETKFHRSVRI